MAGEDEDEIISRNYQLFREHMSQILIQRVTELRGKEEKKKAKHPRSTTRRGHKDKAKVLPDDGPAVDDAAVPDQGDPEELADFIDYIASEAFQSLPEEVQSLSYSKIQEDRQLKRKYHTDAISESTLETLSNGLPTDVAESLAAYGFIPHLSDLHLILHPVLTEYFTSLNSGPPAWHATRASACEICERDWVPLSYHHLIPRSTHAKALKRKWHEEHMLNRVAWLCIACHRFVHRMTSNEELAQRYYTIEKIMERGDAQAWAQWVGRIRWKAK